MDRRVTMVVLSLAVGLAGAGCGGGYTKTVRVEERVQATAPAPASSTVTETTTVQEERKGPRGVLSSTVNFIGEVLALPFRLVGGILRFVF